MRRHIVKKIKMTVLLVFAFAAMLLASACTPNVPYEASHETEYVPNAEDNGDETEYVPAAEEKGDESVDFVSYLTDVETAYVKALQDEGVLKVKISMDGTIYTLSSEGEPKGFHYRLAKSFAEAIGLEAEFDIVKFDDYFKVNGVYPERVLLDETLTFTPDVFKEAHIIADNLTITPWRKQMMSFVEIIPVGVVVVTREDQPVNTLYALKEKTIALVQRTIYAQIIEQIDEKYDLNLGYYYVNTGNEAIRKVLGGEADFTLKDSNVAYYELDNNPGLKVNMAIGDIGLVAWGVQRDNEILRSIIEKYVDYSIETGIFGEIWEEEIGVSLLDYSNMLKLMNEEERQ